MKFLPIIWSGLWRKRMRTLFTILSAIVAFLLFGLLQGVNTAFDQAVNQTQATRLFVVNRTSELEALPIAALEQIKAIPGVKEVTHQILFSGYLREPNHPIVSFAIDPAPFFKIHDEVKISPDALEKFRQLRTGIVVGANLAAEEGWKLGDRVTLKSAVWVRQDGSMNWDFDVVGIVGSASGGVSPILNSLLLNYSYLDESRLFGKGLVGIFLVDVTDPAKAAEVSAAIDQHFQNSASRTRTQTAREIAGAELKQIGDINFMLRTIIVAVLFALLFLTGNTMMQSVNDRIPEFAVMKTLGFSDMAVLRLVLGESLILCGGAAALGLFFAAALFPLLTGLVGSIPLPIEVLLAGIGMAVLLAVLAGVPPALRAGRLKIVDALSGR